MDTQTWLNRHYKSISAKNITILPVSSDAFLTCFSRCCRTENMELQFVFKK